MSSFAWSVLYAWELGAEITVGIGPERASKSSMRSLDSTLRAVEKVVEGF